MAVPLAACGDSDSLLSQPAQESDAKENTVWAWEPTLTQAAKKIHALGDSYYITSDSDDGGFYDSMIWLAGGIPFKTLIVPR